MLDFFRRWLGEVAFYFEHRRGEKQKRAYVQKLVDLSAAVHGNAPHAPERIEQEVAWLESMFFSHGEPEKRRA